VCCSCIRPENKKEKADRLKAEAAARESGKVRRVGWVVRCCFSALELQGPED
jgi:hypothetical protein